MSDSERHRAMPIRIFVYKVFLKVTCFFLKRGDWLTFLYPNTFCQSRRREILCAWERHITILIWKVGLDKH